MAWTQDAAQRHAEGPLFGKIWARTMEKTITEIEDAITALRKHSPWSPDIKVTDDFLDPLFEKFFEKLGLPNLMRKTDYHELARFVSPDALDPEVGSMLDAIQNAAVQASPRRD